MRIGEMERDTFIAHGAAAVLRDRLMFSSDATDFIVCVKCGQIVWHADPNKMSSENPPACRVCGEQAQFAQITMPFVCKLLLQEIQAMGIMPRLQVETE